MQTRVEFGAKPATDVLDPGNKLVFSGAGSGVCRVVGSSTKDYSVAAGVTVGPFLRSTNVTVWATSGSFDVLEVAADDFDAVFQSPVSGAGNQPSATLAATTGTPGQIVRLSDGADAGALLVWAIPAGSSSYTWCWWIYPLAAYL